jgi:hypothetical protein
MPDTAARYSGRIQLPDTAARYSGRIQLPDTAAGYSGCFIDFGKWEKI